MESQPLLLETHLETLGNGKLLRVARLGHGPPLLMLHGYPENLQIWSQLAPLLASRFQVIAFDWPGMGYSEAWPGGATPQIKADRLMTMLDEWKIDKASILGMDMGGQPALAFAARHRDRVERLIVMNSLVFGDEKTSWEIRWLRKFGFNRFALRHLGRVVFRRAESTFFPPGVRLDREIQDDFWRAFSSVEVRRFVSKMCAGYQGTLDKFPALYERITCPTMVLWAERDKHFPLIQAERLHRCIAASQLEVIPDGTHWMALCRAEELAERILEWHFGPGLESERV
ncbi:MAG: alpha/beta hydrolase [Planctomycetota bacterium]|nr:alpha/beta hydrolase [Planctomycetota bacterium]